MPSSKPKTKAPSSDMETLRAIIIVAVAVTFSISTWTAGISGLIWLLRDVPLAAPISVMASKIAGLTALGSVLLVACHHDTPATGSRHG